MLLTRGHRSRPAAAVSSSAAPNVSSRRCFTSQSPASRPVVLARNNWRTFGPTSEYSDGDAEYFQLTSRLSQQYEWFAPRPQQEEETTSPEQDAQQPEEGRQGATFGLTERQIHALGLSGPRTDMPDPVGAAWPGCLPAASPKPYRDEHFRPDLRCHIANRRKLYLRRLTCAGRSSRQTSSGTM